MAMTEDKEQGKEQPIYVHVDNAVVGYGDTAVVKDVDLAVRRGQILTLVGPNGSGKSTILKSIIGQLKLVSGVVYLEGRKMQELSAKEVARRLSILMTERAQPELMTC